MPRQDRVRRAVKSKAAVVMVAAASQVGAFFTSIPQCVLGGMTTFLFAGVCVSGIKVCRPTHSYPFPGNAQNIHMAPRSNIV